MEHRTFWEEELRAFPTGGRGAAVWVVRRDGSDPAAPRLLTGTGEDRRHLLHAARPMAARPARGCGSRGSHAARDGQ